MVRHAGYFYNRRKECESGKGRINIGFILSVLVLLYTVILGDRFMGQFMDGDIDTNLFLDWPRIIWGTY